MEQVRVGVGVFIRRNGKYLLLERQGSHGAGTWSIPGGHLEFKETFGRACVREVFEETGIKLKKMADFVTTNDYFEKENKHYVTCFFVAMADDTEAVNKEPSKCSRLAWFPPEHFPKKLFQPLASVMESENIGRVLDSIYRNTLEEWRDNE